MSATPSEAVVEPAPEFDLFLSYNRFDLAAVDRVAEALRARGLQVCKDDWYLRPGQPWPTALEKRLAESQAVVVAIAGGGLGPWQQREAFAALDLQNRARKAVREPPPVIPLLLDPSSTKKSGRVSQLEHTSLEDWHGAQTTRSTSPSTARRASTSTAKSVTVHLRNKRPSANLPTNCCRLTSILAQQYLMVARPITTFQRIYSTRRRR